MVLAQQQPWSNYAMRSVTGTYCLLRSSHATCCMHGTCPLLYACVTFLTGTEYLLADLGCGVVGFFSLATGQLVKEVRLHSMQVGGAGCVTETCQQLMSWAAATHAKHSDES